MKKVFVFMVMTIAMMATGIDMTMVNAISRNNQIKFYETTAIFRNKDRLTYIDADKAYGYLCAFDDSDILVVSETRQVKCGDIDWSGYTCIDRYDGDWDTYLKYEIHDDVIVLHILGVDL